MSLIIGLYLLITIGVIIGLIMMVKVLLEKANEWEKLEMEKKKLEIEKLKKEVNEK